MARCGWCGLGLLAADRAKNKCARCGTRTEPPPTKKYLNKKGQHQATTPPYKLVPNHLEAAEAMVGKEFVCFECRRGNHDSEHNPAAYCKCCRQYHDPTLPERTFEEVVAGGFQNRPPEVVDDEEEEEFF